MLFNKGMFILATPCLVWAQVETIEPGHWPLELRNCMHVERTPVDEEMTCTEYYTCTGRRRHMCRSVRAGQAQECTECGDLANPRYVGDCGFGDHTEVRPCNEHC
ncbi:hypothetical protein PGT21_019510 [Puccinia graminis f. sp. tritici]|uniref:Secreted protein n=1 Tax=Puccinia graminis f. sp. tritici TaxID=56615 RepID=A0A5B0QTT0_PUCGR|nr:hypothetical protein PGT21_019510 [Puccinia graminis f. sp. tritici]